MGGLSSPLLAFLFSPLEFLHPFAGGGKTKECADVSFSDVYRPRGHRSRAFRSRARRRVLYWRLAESSAQLWTVRCDGHIRPGALDLL